MHLEGSSALLNSLYQIFPRSCICILIYGRGFGQQKRCPQKSPLFPFELVILVFMIPDRVLLLLLGSSYSQFRHYLWTPPLPHVVIATLWICKYYSQLSQRVELLLPFPSCTVIHKNVYQNINVLIILSSNVDFTSGLSLLKTFRCIRHPIILISIKKFPPELLNLLQSGLLAPLVPSVILRSSFVITLRFLAFASCFDWISLLSS